MDINGFRSWLDRYGEAWVNGDPEAVVGLFSEDALYFEEPFEPPMKGRETIRKYWQEGAQESQTDIDFKAEIISLGENVGYAHWQATFTRVPANRHVGLDGILKAVFDDEGQCVEFREWWRRKEA